MPKTHPDDTARIAYRIKPPSVWRAIRAEWEAGETPAELARRFDVSASTVQLRRDREGWSRDGTAAPLVAVAPTATWPAGWSPAASVDLIDMLAVTEVALARAVQGRAREAMALVDAGDKVGCFAAYVSELRAEAAAERTKVSGEPPPEAAGGAKATLPPP